MNITHEGSDAESTRAIFERLRKLKRDCAPTSTKHELAVVLISSCICEGFDTGRRITRALETLGLNRQYAGKILSEETGNDPKRHRWQRDEEGRYTLLD